MLLLGQVLPKETGYWSENMQYWSNTGQMRRHNSGGTCHPTAPWIVVVQVLNMYVICCRSLWFWKVVGMQWMFSAFIMEEERRRVEWGKVFLKLFYAVHGMRAYPHPISHQDNVGGVLRPGTPPSSIGEAKGGMV